MSLLEAASRLFSVVTVARDQGADAEEVEATDDGGSPIKVKGGGGLQGFYSVAGRGIYGLIARTPLGGYLLRYFTEPPAGSVAGESGITIGETHLRFLPTGNVVLESKSGATITVDGTTGYVTIAMPDWGQCQITQSAGAGAAIVARHLDGVNMSAGLAAWVAAVDAVCRAINPGMAPIPVDPVGAVQSTATALYSN